MPGNFGAFRAFLRAARGRSQEEIIIEFLASTVLNDPVADNGSVLINHPKRKMLITFNEGDFLFEKNYWTRRRGAAGQLRNPLILDGSVDGVERSLFEQHLPETLHKGSQALFRHHRD